MLQNDADYQIAGLQAPANHFWVFPVLVGDPESVELHLRVMGFDADRRGSMVVVQPPSGRDCPAPENARVILDQAVFLPLYYPMTLGTMDKLARAVIEGDPTQKSVPTQVDACVRSVPESLAQDT